jgi:tetratricopeptide (TPR) repeat protein
MPATKHYTELIEEARNVEGEGELEKAASIYEQAIKQHPMDEFPYNRLMIIYRKFKQPKEEYRVINKALDVYRSYYDEKLKPYTSNTKIGQLSKALLKSVTGNAKKTSYTSYPEPIPRWTLRKKAVEKKLDNKKK